MLKSLYIKNFAIIEEQIIKFGQGLNVITGETGAGKSIIIDALRVLLGGRAYIDYVRQGERKAVIEAIFELDSNNHIFNFIRESGYDNLSNEIIIRREIPANGNSRSFFNDSPIQTSLLKEIAQQLVDFHGQHDNHFLTKTDTHINIFDKTSDYIDLLEEFENNYKDLNKLVSDYNKLLNQEEKLKEQAAFNRFRLEEIMVVNPQENEDEELEKELKLLENSELLHINTQRVADIIMNNDYSSYSYLVEAKKLIEDLARVDSEFMQWSAEINTAIVSIKEIAMFANDYNTSIKFSPERIEEIRLRLLELKGLQKKYGNLNSIIELKKQLSQSIENDKDIDKIIKQKYDIIIEKKHLLGELALRLNKQRKDYSKVFSQKVETILKDLDMPNAVFNVHLTTQEYNAQGQKQTANTNAIIEKTEYQTHKNGVDSLEFYISTNKGEEPMALAKVASGGEISRIMLALKSILAQVDELALLVFDEIDSGISGNTAQKVGLRMKKLAESHQIIAITHLPQIASLADYNFDIIKKESNGRTLAITNSLSGNGKKELINKMISGINI